MLDATDVQSETDLGQATEPQVTNWDAALDGPEEQPTEQAEANAEQSPADTADAAGDNAEPAEDRPAGESLESAEDYIKRIRRAREVVRHTAADWESAKEEAKDAKKAWEKAVEDLTVAIDRGRERYPLFEHLEQEQAAGDLNSQPRKRRKERKTRVGGPFHSNRLVCRQAHVRSWPTIRSGRSRPSATWPTGLRSRSTTLTRSC